MKKLSFIFLFSTTALWCDQCQITSPLPVPVSISGCTFSSVLPSGSTSYIQNTSSLQAGATYYVSSGTVQNSLSLSYLTANQCIQANSSGQLVSSGGSCGGSGTPGGSNLWAQYNNNGAFGGYSYMTFASTGVNVSTTSTLGPLTTIPATSSLTISGTLLANGSAGNTGQVLVSNGNGAAPTFVDPVVSQSVDANLNASVSIKGSSNTVQITGTPNVSVTNTPNVNIPLSVQLTSGTPANPLTVNVPLAIQLASGTPTNPLSVTVGASTVTINNGTAPGITGVISATNTVVAASSTWYSSMVTFTLFPSTWSGIYAFEISPDTGVTWLPILATRMSNQVTVSSYSQTVNFDTSTWQVNIAGNTNFRVRAAVSNAGPGNTSSCTIIVQSIPHNPLILATMAVNISSNGLTVPWPAGYVANGSSVPVNVLNTITANVPVAIQLASSTLNVNVPLAIQLASNTINVSGSGSFNVMQGSQSATASWRVDASTWGTVANPWTTNVPLAVQLASNTINVNGAGNFNVMQGSQSAVFSWRVDASTWGTSANPFTVNVPLSIQLTSSTLQVIGTLSDNGVAAATNRVATLPGIARTRFGQTGAAYTEGNNAAIPITSSGAVVRTGIFGDNTIPIYAASTMTFTVENTTSDISGICGNTRNVVEVTGLRLSCTQTTAGVIPVSIAYRSTAYVGTWSTITPVGFDPNFNVAVSTAIYEPASGLGITNGTLVGYIDSYRQGCIGTATATPNDIYISPSDWRLLTPFYLRTASQCLGISIPVTVTGGTFSVSWIWRESPNPTP